MCHPKSLPSEDEMFWVSSTGELKPLTLLEKLLLDGEYPMIGDRPLKLPPGYWGIIVHMDEELH